MEYASEFLISLGGIFLLGLLADRLGKQTILPRVTLLLLFGIVIGNDVLNIIPSIFLDHYAIIAEMTLLMVGFLLGGKLTISSLKQVGTQVLLISISAAFITTAIVIFILLLTGVQKEIAILLGCIASATAPAAVFDVVAESQCKGKFGDILLSVVALDDAWALIIFSMGTIVIKSLAGVDAEAMPYLAIVKEVGLAVIIGFVIGVPSAYVTARLRHGQPILVGALGVVFVCGGLAIMFDVSFLIASMVLGAVVANSSKNHEYPFHAIESIEWPFMVIFFILSGAYLELGSLKDIGGIGVVYIISRMLGKYLGSMVGSQLSNANKGIKRYMGVALFPQAGVAIGMALIASSYFPEYRQILMSVVISSTIFFEIIGPVFTKKAMEMSEKLED